MSPTLHVGQRVFWWKRVTAGVNFPYAATVLSHCKRRVTIAVDDPEGGTAVLTRHVAAESLQPVGRYFAKVGGQGPGPLPPVAPRGLFTRYLDIGEDLRALRHVDVYKNGNMLSYDRSHWVDTFGMLGDARLNRNRKEGPWGRSVEIEPTEFETAWDAARRSPCWQEQVACAQMSHCGNVPVWLTITGLRPLERPRRRRP